MKKTTVPRETIQIAGRTIHPGERRRFDIPVALLPTHTELHMPVEVIHHGGPGPRLWLSAAIHGDELNGIEVIRRVLATVDTIRCGTLLAVPIVNAFGFIHQSRYLPDRRDLNRSFPGSMSGSLAGRVAHLFLREIVDRCTHGIDLHTASLEKSNYPQVRGNMYDPETRRCAEAFGAPAMLHSTLRDGSLRAVASKRGISVLLYEAGEPQRFNEPSIRAGVRGVLGVMRYLGMIKGKPKPTESVFIPTSRWLRARRGGLLRLTVDEGDRVKKKQKVGVIADPLGTEEVPVVAPHAGLIIGKTNNPVVHGGDAILHIGNFAEES